MNPARFHLHFGDLTDTSNIMRIVQETRPDEIYNLGAQSHVAVSFETPEYTANAEGMGTLRLLEVMRILDLKNTRFYQASTSEMFGLSQQVLQNEQTPFYPRSPYGAAKLSAHWITVNYREAYGMHVLSGILFNHGASVRGETFVTRKITRGRPWRSGWAGRERLYIGNLEARRDWGHARDFVYGMWLMMQQDTPDDYVSGHGRGHQRSSIRGNGFRADGCHIVWKGQGVDEKGYDADDGRLLIEGRSPLLSPYRSRSAYR